MIASSALRVASQTASRLVITDPPYSLIGTIFLGIGVLTILVILAVAFKVHTKQILILIMGLAVALPFVLVGVFLCTTRNQMDFSRDSNRITIQNQYFAGMVSSRQVIPLDSVLRAVIETGRGGARRLVLVTRSGDAIPLTNFTGQGGYYRALDAVNHFLGAAPQRGEPGR